MSTISAAGWCILPAWARGSRSGYAVLNDLSPFQQYPVHNIPADKKLDPQWIKSLYHRGLPSSYLKSKNELQYIGMPAGGLHSGTLYLGGDGRLWLWEIYNDDREGIDPKSVSWNDSQKVREIRNRDGANYISPAIAENKRLLEQGIALCIHYLGKTYIKELKEDDWDEIRFEATYPLAKVIYTTKELPIEIILTGGAFFVPLSVEKSELPATSLHIQVKNTSSSSIEVSIIGWLENGVRKMTAKNDEGKRQNRWIQKGDCQIILSSFFSDGQTISTSDAPQDQGTMCLALMQPGGIVNTDCDPSILNNTLFTKKNVLTESKDTEHKLIGSIATEQKTIRKGEILEATFVISWHFNHSLKKLQARMPESKQGYFYGARFQDAADVLTYIQSHFQELRDQTLLWQKTFYDSSLPYWFLERTFLNIGTIATANTYRFASGRFWGWEGVNACEGTCTHVWQYGHSLARIFPELERDTRERVDLGVGMQPDGAILFRGEFENRPAIDGQAGTILRFYREHQMSTDDKFLNKNWDNIKKTVRFMLSQDKNGDGMTDTPMENTLDAVWEGEISWIVGLCIAAAKAAQMMAEEMQDDNFAEICRLYVEKGNQNMAEKLFNGEYFIHRPDPVQGRKKLGSYNTCHIDQVFGQSWAYQVGLGRLWDKEKTVSALRSLWKYNFSPDVGPYIKTHIGGRPYALKGEAGLIMNTNPHNEPKPYGEDTTWQLGYFHECMSGFEHQVAAHMMAEGMTDESMILTRSIHDRYHGSKRNPYNEIECSDHYARAMASYGTFITACGFEYHGPEGYIRFSPKLSADNFKAPFTAAEGWGSYAQQINKQGFHASYQVQYGQLRLKKIGVDINGGVSSRKSVVKLILAESLGDKMQERRLGKQLISQNGTKSIKAQLVNYDNRMIIELNSSLIIEAGYHLIIDIS